MNKRKWLKHLGFATSAAIVTSSTLTAKENNKMTDEDYKQLENLLGKLQLEIGAGRFCIFPGYTHDMVHVSVFNGSGELVKSVTAPTIKEVVDKLKSSSLNDPNKKGTRGNVSKHTRI